MGIDVPTVAKHAAAQNQYRRSVRCPADFHFSLSEGTPIYIHFPTRYAQPVLP